MTFKGLKKLIKHPIHFYNDYQMKKRPKKPTPKKPTPKKPTPKKPTPKKPTAKKPADIIYEEYQIDFFYPYKAILHTGEGENGITHLNLWLPHFKHSGVDFLVLVRNYTVFQYIKEHYEELSIVFAKGNKEVNNCLSKLKSLEVCFYPSNTGNNLHLLQFNEFTHIFIGHGDSDKTASAHKYFRVYDQNWVAGQAHIDRFNNAGFNHRGLQHIKVGRPNLKETLEQTQADWKERYDGNLHLLYLSTWEGFLKEQNYTSVYIIKDFFEKITELSDRTNDVKVKLHPLLGRRDKTLENFSDSLIELFEANAMRAEIFPKDKPVEELIKESNVFICDISAVVSESLAGNGPIFVYIPKDKPIKLSQSNMSFEDYTYTFSTIEELIEKFTQVVVEGNDYIANKRKEAMEYILGYKETLNDQFIIELEKVGKEHD